LTEYNKRTTLQDIGVMLDRFIIEDKAMMNKYGEQIQYEDKLKYPLKDQSNWNMSIFGQAAESKDPSIPHYMDQQDNLGVGLEGSDTKMMDIL
jgi:hypothetical protein